MTIILSGFISRTFVTFGWGRSSVIQNLSTVAAHCQSLDAATVIMAFVRNICHIQCEFFTKDRLGEIPGIFEGYINLHKSGTSFPPKILQSE